MTVVGHSVASVCPRSRPNRKTIWAVNTELDKCMILYSSRSACIDPEVKRSKVKVTQLRKPSQLLVMCTALLLLAWVCMSIRLSIFSSLIHCDKNRCVLEKPGILKCHRRNLWYSCGISTSQLTYLTVAVDITQKLCPGATKGSQKWGGGTEKRGPMGRGRGEVLGDGEQLAPCPPNNFWP